MKNQSSTFVESTSRFQLIVGHMKRRTGVDGDDGDAEGDNVARCFGQLANRSKLDAKLEVGTWRYCPLHSQIPCKTSSPVYWISSGWDHSIIQIPGTGLLGFQPLDPSVDFVLRAHREIHV